MTTTTRATAALLAIAALPALGQSTQPWMDKQLSPQARAELVLQQLTLDEKIGLLHGEGMWHQPNLTPEIRNEINGGVGLVRAVPRLGLPAILMADAAYGVRGGADAGRYSTALPSNLASAASWDTEAACSYGALIGREIRAQGFNMSLGGGVNLTREPRNGRTFEYMGEDPVLAGTLGGERIRCEGEQHVLNEIKHFALNDQESGRQSVDVRIGERAARESDLLAFEIGLRRGQPKAVMCSYNSVNGSYACENRWLLTDILKKEWAFQGFVVSDWGGAHSTEKASAAGLDQEQPGMDFYGGALKAAVQAGRVPQAELDDHVRRVLWAEFASGIVDDPPRHSVPDPGAGYELSRRLAEQSAVLLRNQRQTLPLEAARLHSIAVIGAHADREMLSGGGSAQVDPPGRREGEDRHGMVWFPTSPLDAIRKKAPGAAVRYASGEDIAEAVALARTSEVAVVFAWQWEHEAVDLPSLSLPGDQDKLIAAVTAANPRTVVVLQTGTAVTMPWLDRTAAVLEAWYGGSKAADAVANLLFGDVNPSGKLPMTFPRSEADLPRPILGQPPVGEKNGVVSLTVRYDEGLKVGYKWYDAEHKAPLFPFGFGLSYTSFRYSNLLVAKDARLVSLTVTNTGKRKGAEIVELYAQLPDSAGEPPKRLVGFRKVELAPGESRQVEIAVDPLYLSVWDETAGRWVLTPGEYVLRAGGSSTELPLAKTVVLP